MTEFILIVLLAGVWAEIIATACGWSDPWF